MNAPGTVYLICFDAPLPRSSSPTRHYLGWAKDLPARLKEHASGNGSRLMAAVVRRGIGWRVVRTWPGDRHLERQLKKRRQATVLCPNCRNARHARRMETQRARRTARKESRS